MTKEAETSLEEKVREQEIQIDRISTTLEVLLERRDKEKAAICRTISADIKKNVFPFLERMTTEPLSSVAQTYLALIKKNLEKCDRRFNSHPIPPTLIPANIIDINPPIPI